MADDVIRFQLISDVHLEFLGSKAPDIPQHAPVLAIVGDLGTLTACYLSLMTFLSLCC